MEDINVTKIFQMKDVIDPLPFILQGHKNILVTKHKLTPTSRSKVFSYKITVESIELHEGQTLKDDIYPCKYENSEFYDQDFDHIITEDLPLIKI